jgi:flavin prenyltransferase
MLQCTDVETHLIISRWGARTLLHETDYQLADVKRMASRTYSISDMGATLSSGSFVTRGMIVAPCSMRTLSAIAHGQSDNLIHRAADVVLKERRKLVLAVRESPLSDVHLENMAKLSRMGVVICPPVPAFYHRPRSLEDIIDYTVVRLLDQVGLHVDVPGRWDGAMATAAPSDTAAVERGSELPQN